MFEGDLLTTQLDSTSFVDHHSRFCNEHRLSPSSCPDIGLLRSEASAQCVARLVGTGESATPLKATLPDIKLAWKAIRKLTKSIDSGLVKASDPVAGTLASAVLWEFGLGRGLKATLLLQLFATTQDADSALSAAIESTFGLSFGSLS